MGSPGRVASDKRRNTKVETIVNLICVFLLMLICGWSFMMWHNLDRLTVINIELVKETNSAIKLVKDTKKDLIVNADLIDKSSRKIIKLETRMDLVESQLEHHKH